MDESLPSLIELVQEFPQIWDKKDPQFRDKLSVKNAWDTIAAVLAIPVDECMFSWNSIRTRYIKERKITKTLPSGSQSYTCKWPLYELCSFLDAAISMRRTKGNIQLSSSLSKKQMWEQYVVEEHSLPPEEAELSSEGIAEKENSCTSSIINTQEVEKSPALSLSPSTSILQPTLSPSTSHNSASQHSKSPTLSNLKKEKNMLRKRKTDEPLQCLVATCSKLGDALSAALNSKELETSENEDYHFVQYLMKSLEKKKIRKRKLQLQARILDLIANEESDD